MYETASLCQVGHHHHECKIAIPKCVLCGGPTSRSARTAECSIPLVMNRTFTEFQLNVRKQQMGQHSLMNDERLKGFAVLGISESYARKIDNKVIILLCIPIRPRRYQQSNARKEGVPEDALDPEKYRSRAGGSTIARHHCCFLTTAGAVDTGGVYIR